MKAITQNFAVTSESNSTIEMVIKELKDLTERLQAAKNEGFYLDKSSYKFEAVVKKTDRLVQPHVNNSGGKD